MRRKITLLLILASFPILSSTSSITTLTVQNQNFLVKECSILVKDNIVLDTREQFSLKDTDPLPPGIEFEINNTLTPRIKNVCRCTVNKLKAKHSQDSIMRTSKILLDAIDGLKDAKTGCAKLINEDFTDEITNPKFRTQILDLEKTDQKIRKGMVSAENINKTDINEFNRVNAEIQKKLKLLLNNNGWPTKKDIGVTGLNALGILLTHSDEKMLIQALAYFKSLFEKGNISGHYVALITDKLLVSKGKKQLYGTQFNTANGKLVLSPIKDKINVDERRKEMGLMSLEEYTKFFREIEKQNTSKEL